MQQHHPAAAIRVQKNAAIRNLNRPLRLQPRPLDSHVQLYERLN
jgi:hypothetical protein